MCVLRVRVGVCYPEKNSNKVFFLTINKHVFVSDKVISLTHTLSPLLFVSVYYYCVLRALYIMLQISTTLINLQNIKRNLKSYPSVQDQQPGPITVIKIIKAATGNFHFVLSLAAPVDKSGGVSKNEGCVLLPRVINTLIWLVHVFVLEVSDRKTGQLCFSHEHIGLFIQ